MGFRHMKRTSLTHPLQIATVSAGPGVGGVGITFCPGKYDPNAHTGGWERDLAIDLDAIRTWGASAVITLVEHKELMLLKVPNLALQLLFCFEVRALGGGLVSSTPE